MKMSKNPWQTQGTESENSENPPSPEHQNTYQGAVEFEDNFTSFNDESEAAENCDTKQQQQQEQQQRNSDITPLPDSASYLKGLERKLQKIKKGSNLIEALAEKRQDCLRSLLNDQITSLHETQSELDTPIDSDSTVSEIYRHLQPIQPITIGETVHIVKYDQLEEQHETAAELDNDSPDK